MIVKDKITRTLLGTPVFRSHARSLNPSLACVRAAVPTTSQKYIYIYNEFYETPPCPSARYVPVIGPQVSHREVNLWNVVVRDEVLPRGEGPHLRVSLDAAPGPGGVEALLAGGQQVVGVQALDEAGHLLDPLLEPPRAVTAARLVDELPGHDGGVVLHRRGACARRWGGDDVIVSTREKNEREVEGVVVMASVPFARRKNRRRLDEGSSGSGGSIKKTKQRKLALLLHPLPPLSPSPNRPPFLTRYATPVYTLTRSMTFLTLSLYIDLHLRSLKNEFLLGATLPDQSRYCATPPLYSQ